MTSSRQASMYKIASAAKRLFARKGYANASLEDIATLAGFTKGAVYHFFRSKEALLTSILHDIEERSVMRTSRMVDAFVGSEMDKLQYFKKLQSQWAARNADDLAILIWVSIESAHRKSAARAQVQRYYAHMEKLLTGILERGKASGEFSPDLQVYDTVIWLISVHDGNMLMWYRSGRSKEMGRCLTLASMQAARLAVSLDATSKLGSATVFAGKPKRRQHT